MVVAAHGVPAGTVLLATDLRVDHVPRGTTQPGALTTIADAVGRRVGAGLARGESLTASRLVPRGALDGLPAGRVALHVVSADPAAVDLLAPGTGRTGLPRGRAARRWRSVPRSWRQTRRPMAARCPSATHHRAVWCSR